MCRLSAPTDAELFALAGRYRVITHAQLVTAGLTMRGIIHRVEQGRLRRLWSGVYLVGPAPPHPLSLAQGGVAATDYDGFVSHRWSPYVWGFAEVPDLPVDVTVTKGSRRGRPGKVRVHLSRILEPRDVTTHDGIRVTTPARALLEIAPSTTLHRLERYLADAQVAKVVTEAQINDVLARAGRHPGARKLRTLIGETAGVTLSEAERILSRLLKAADLPQPLINHPIGRYRADFAWPAKKLIVEFDGYAAHGHRAAFHHDRRRNAERTAQGYSVMQVTWRQLTDEPTAVVARIAAALATS